MNVQERGGFIIERLGLGSEYAAKVGGQAMESQVGFLRARLILVSVQGRGGLYRGTVMPRV